MVVTIIAVIITITVIVLTVIFIMIIVAMNTLTIVIITSVTIDNSHSGMHLATGQHPVEGIYYKNNPDEYTALRRVYCIATIIRHCDD